MNETKIGLAFLSEKNNDEVSQDIIEKAKHVTLRANTTVFYQGDGCKNYLLVLSGSVKVFTRTEHGREIVLYRVGEGESCILTTTCLMAEQSYPAEGIAESDVDAIVISAQDFNFGLAQSKYFRNLVFENYSKRLADVIALIAEVNFNRIDIRLAKFLMKYQKNQVIEITHQELSIELGTAREVVSRHLKILEDNRWVKLSRGRINIIDQESIKKLAITKVL
jgi:CRP/FNR family transcriptional regulator